MSSRHGHRPLGHIPLGLVPPQEVRVKVEGDPPNTQGIVKVTAMIHYDDDDVMEVELWGENATFWERYTDELGFVVRSLKPSKESAYIGEERVTTTQKKLRAAFKTP